MTSTEPTYEINTTYKITAQDLKDILCTAFEGGSNYWIAEVRLCGWKKVGPNDYRYDGQPEPNRGVCPQCGADSDYPHFEDKHRPGCLSSEALQAEHYHEIPALGGTLQVREYGEPCLYHNLTSNALLRGISRAAQEGRINPAVEEWTSNVDAEIADVILQYAVLNDIVYG